MVKFKNCPFPILNLFSVPLEFLDKWQNIQDQLTHH